MGYPDISSREFVSVTNETLLGISMTGSQHQHSFEVSGSFLSVVEVHMIFDKKLKKVKIDFSQRRRVHILFTH
jgi:hypothetical protein